MHEPSDKSPRKAPSLPQERVSGYALAVALADSVENGVRRDGYESRRRILACHCRRVYTPDGMGAPQKARRPGEGEKP